MADHVRPKRKPATAEFYRDILDRIVKPAIGTTKADKLTRLQVGKLHSSLSDTPFQANRVLAVIGSVYALKPRFHTRECKSGAGESTSSRKQDAKDF